MRSLQEEKQRNCEAVSDTPLGLRWELCLLEGLESCAEPEEWGQGCWCKISLHGLTTRCLVLPYTGDNSVASLCLALPSLGRNLSLV